MSLKKKTRAQLEAQNKFLRIGKAFETFASIGNSLIKWGGLVFISYYIYLSIVALSGKDTNAKISLSTFLSLFTSEGISFNCSSVDIITVIIGILSGISGISYGIGQRRLRQSYIEYRPKRYEDLEKRIDNKRSSSQLTSKGDTRPEDI